MAGEVRTYNVVDPNAPGGERTRVMGVLYAPRRQPTADEVKRINQSLEAVERDLDAGKAVPPPSLAPPAPRAAASSPDA